VFSCLADPGQVGCHRLSVLCDDNDTRLTLTRQVDREDTDRERDIRLHGQRHASGRTRALNSDHAGD
jgi:hypothetical protein